MVKLINLQEAQAAYAQRAADETANAKYLQNAVQASEDWKAAADKATPQYNAGVQAAMSRNAYGRGIAATSAEDYAQGISTKGVQNRLNGIANGGAERWANGFAPMASGINQMLPSLPTKGQDINANIDNRLKPLANRLRAIKEGRVGTLPVTQARPRQVMPVPQRYY